MPFDTASIFVGIAIGAVLGFAACFLLLMLAPDDGAKRVSPRRWQ